MKIHRDRRDDAARRQRTARRFAVGRGRRLGASSTLDGYPDPPFGPLLPSHLPRPIPATSGDGSGPLARRSSFLDRSAAAKAQPFPGVLRSDSARPAPCPLCRKRGRYLESVI